MLVITTQKPLSKPSTAYSAPPREEWDEAIKPAPGTEDKIDVGCRSGESVAYSMAQVRENLAQLSYHKIDPFVATVAAGVSAGRTSVPDEDFKVTVEQPRYFKGKIELDMALHNGQEAPMMVILPGIYGGGTGGFSKSLKKMALERGMNYVVIPNALSKESLKDQPINHPGNPRVEAEATHQLLRALKRDLPQNFSKISIAGYSYGGLLGANLVRFDEELADARPDIGRIINGSLISISPPENLDHSMRQLDGLRDDYATGAGSIIGTGLKYRSHTRRYGYEGFLESSLAERGEGTNITEIKIADSYGSRDDLQKMIQTVDVQFDHNKLPKNTEEYRNGSGERRSELRKEHKEYVENVTYDQFSDNWMAEDKWLKDRGLSPQAMADEYSYSNALEVIDETPVMTLVSADDYILNSEDVETYRQIEKNQGPLEPLRVFDNGGHVGLLWNPEVQNTLADFAYSAPNKS